MPGFVEFQKPEDVTLEMPEHFSDDLKAKCAKTIGFDEFTALTTSVPAVWKKTVDALRSSVEIHSTVKAVGIGEVVRLAGDDVATWREALKVPDEWGIPFWMAGQILHYVDAVEKADKAKD